MLTVSGEGFKKSETHAETLSVQFKKHKISLFIVTALGSFSSLLMSKCNSKWSVTVRFCDTESHNISFMFRMKY